VWARDRVLKAQADDELVISESSGKFSVRFKQYLRDERGVMRKGKPLSVLNGPFTQEGTDELYQLFGTSVFDFPKPSSLIRYFLSFAVNGLEDKDAIVLDFFAGSGSTGQAVLDLNRQDGGNRKFILVQLPEPIERNEFSNIAQITEERVRRVIRRIGEERAGELPLDGPQTDPGFKVLKLGASNFNTWKADMLGGESGTLSTQLDLHVDHIRADRHSEDILFEVLLKSGYPLSTRVESLTIEGATVYSISDGLMLICLDRNLTHCLIKAMAERDPGPERIVCLDAGFAGNDQLKTNAVQTMKARGVTSFRTV